MQASPAPDKRQQILDAALELMASHGFEGFSIKQLAGAAGVAAGTIYLYFKDKQQLMEQLHLNLIEDLAGAMFEQFDASLDLYGRYQRICRNLWGFCLAEPQRMISKGQFDNLPPEVLRTQLRGARDVFKPLLDLFECGRRSGAVSALPDEMLYALAIDPYCQLARWHHLGLVEVGPADLERMIEGAWRAITPAP